MAWKTMDIQEQRIQFVVAAHRGEKTMAALCQEFGISRPVGYEWMSRYRQSGIAGIVERSRRPQNSPKRTHGAIEQRVVELRRRYPDWGARKLRVLLEREGIGLAAGGPAFDLAGANKIVGAPSFAHFAKGGIVERMRDVVAQPQKLCRQHRYPPLQKTQGRGTLTIVAHATSSKDGPARPCKKRKDGAPSP